ncbi:benzoate-CoA ligase family protein [Arenibaculum sp.]|uniref:benzoate-CoA ligase family protein n=1 Tax=Arenibaculum sp. TaxID=2865862 RepID=UPI002E107CB2|nr:benzoate-CoA ligase family protein [Arenibaculum sp.]
MSAGSAHVDTFAHDNLPPRDQWPVMNFDLPELRYPERLNCGVELLDRMVGQGHGDRPCIIAPGGTWTYSDLKDRADRIARVLTEDLGVVPGNRVLLRAANNPMMVACWFAVMKAGAVAVPTMPLLRAGELTVVAEKAQVTVALCDARLADEMEAARRRAPVIGRIAYFNGEGGPESLEARMAAKPGGFANVDTAADDICMIAFTSGTTGTPKGTMHVHRDVLAICDTFSRHVLKPQPDDVFCGSPPLAFTFGLGGLVTFPLRVGAATLLLEKATPDALLDGIAAHRATVCFTAPTAYRAMLGLLKDRDISSLRKCVSAGEALPLPTWQAFREATGIEIIDGIGSTEMLHIFISASGSDIRPGSTGRPVPGYEACVLDEEGRPVPPGTVGRLAVRGPTGCRYLADDRQRNYVQGGWNLTGDAYKMDEDGYFWYQARTDDMIVSSGYNIAGPEVERALLAHADVAECAVIGAPDPERGQIVKAFVVLKPGVEADTAKAKALQDFVKQEIAPYKYPRAIEFVEALPRTESGKVQRFRLREMERGRLEEAK